MKRRLILASAALAAPAFARPAAAEDAAAANRAIAERFAATLTAHDMAAFAALFSDDYINHQVSAAAPPPPAGISPKQGTLAFYGARLAGIPDLKVGIEASVADAQKVAASFIYSGTHGGLYFGIPATGRALRFTSCDIFAVRGGRIVEHWGMGDIAGVLAQLRA